MHDVAVESPLEERSENDTDHKAGETPKSEDKHGNGTKEFSETAGRLHGPRAGDKWILCSQIGKTKENHDISCGMWGAVKKSPRQAMGIRQCQ
jgi:hypothetical protein